MIKNDIKELKSGQKIGNEMKVYYHRTSTEGQHGKSVDL